MAASFRIIDKEEAQRICWPVSFAAGISGPFGTQDGAAPA
jgi:hypothetical protein